MKNLLILTLSLIVFSMGCQTSNGEVASADSPDKSVIKPAAEAPASKAINDKFAFPSDDMAPAGKGIATFAGGCFWCMEKPFETIDGVEAVYSGYTGGPEKYPEYKQVAGGRTGHTEAVRIIYDPAKVKYELLLDVFWRNIHPTQVNGQFVDNGTQYRSGIYPHDAEQKRLAEVSKAVIQKKFEEPIATEIVDAGAFWPAENYHQDFYIKSPAHYERYRTGSGRDQYLKKVWGDEAGGYSLHSKK